MRETLGEIFSLGEGGLRPAWNSKAALIHPAAGFLAQRGTCLSLPEAEGEGGMTGNAAWLIKRLSGLGIAL
jgi:hypothetical protein